MNSKEYFLLELKECPERVRWKIRWGILHSPSLTTGSVVLLKRPYQQGRRLFKNYWWSDFTILNHKIEITNKVRYLSTGVVLHLQAGCSSIGHSIIADCLQAKGVSSNSILTKRAYVSKLKSLNWWCFTLTDKVFF
jgi:hypothetical protein